MPPKNKKVYKSDRKTQKLKGKLAKDKNKTQKKKKHLVRNQCLKTQKNY